MAEPITIMVKGSDVGGNDAPTVEDLLSQIQDLVGLLKSVEDAVGDGGKREIVWKVTNVTRNSPLKFEITPYPQNHAMNIDRRARQVAETTARGLQALAVGGARPEYFSDEIVSRAERVYERVSNGLDATVIDFSKYLGAPTIEITKENANTPISAIRAIRAPQPTPHVELGSVEGTISKVELDGFKRPVVWLRARLDGAIIKCVAADGALDRIGRCEIREILRGMRVSVFGTINYKDIEEIASIEVDGIHIFDSDENLPSHQDIVSPDFTHGVEASKYLEALRING